MQSACGEVEGILQRYQNQDFRVSLLHHGKRFLPGGTWVSIHVFQGDFLQILPLFLVAWGNSLCASSRAHPAAGILGFPGGAELLEARSSWIHRKKNIKDGFLKVGIFGNPEFGIFGNLGSWSLGVFQYLRSLTFQKHHNLCSSSFFFFMVIIIIILMIIIVFPPPPLKGSIWICKHSLPLI